MSQVRYNAAVALSEFLAPFLDDIPVIAQQQAYDTDAVFPSVVILPQKHTYFPIVMSEVNVIDDQKLLAKAGTMEGTVELRVYCTSAPDRDLIEQRLTEAFFAQSMLRPGVVVLETAPFNYGGVPWTDKALVAYEILDGDWKEERVFTDKRYSFMTLNSQYELFVSFNNIPTIKEIDIYIEDFSGHLIEETKVI